MEQEIISKVWKIPGLFGAVTAGLLVFENGNVTYITDDGVQFTVPLSELTEVKYPMLRMGMGFDTVIRGKKYKFCFSKPNPSAPELGDSVANQFLRGAGVGRLWESIGSLRNIKQDKATMRQWKALMSPGE